MCGKFPFLSRVFAWTIAALLVVGLPPKIRAAIVWKQKTVELHADAKSTVLEARFPFSNAGGTPVDITQVESSCGCTVASLEKRHYEPHETGEIVARYTVGTQAGVQKKTVLVATDDGQPPTTLTLEIHIPEVVRVRPAFVQWQHGESPAAKSITLEIMQDIPARDVSVRSSAAGFEAEIKPLVPGRKYELKIHPLNTDQQQFSTLSIRCRFGDEEKVFPAYASVRMVETKD